MSTLLARTAVDFVQVDHALALVDDLVADAVAACVHARASRIGLQLPAEQTLRAIREAGRRLSRVQRSDGGRPLNNASRGLTRYQCAVKQAGISRQTASIWRQVAEVPEGEFDLFIAETKLANRDLTVAAVLRACRPKPETARAGRTVKLVVSEAEYRTFQQQVGVLGAVYFTATTTETVMAVLAHAYSGWLAAQIRKPSGKSRSKSRVA
jgi:hypothetical protein